MISLSKVIEAGKIYYLKALRPIRVLFAKEIFSLRLRVRILMGMIIAKLL